MQVRNAWYVAGWTDTVGVSETLAIKILNEPIVVFRTESGKVVALADRCRHRAAPLSKGRVEGEEIRCMYHGFKYAVTGACTQIPGQSVPSTARVTSYPIVEKHSWLWVWMGDPAKADPDLIPTVSGPDEGRFVLKPGQIDYAADARLVCDNLLDFSHLSYVHPTTFGVTEEWAATRPRIEMRPRGIHLERWVRDQPPPYHQPELGRIDYWNEYDFSVPGILSLTFQMFPVGTAERHDGRSPGGDPALLSYSYALQAVTPMTEGTARYFFAYGPRVEEDVDGYAEAFSAVANAAFLEDKDVIEAQQARLNDGEADMLIVGADSALVQFRRLVEKLSVEENASTRETAYVA
jgi:vanillate O-demethylase monooxygenase subunit